MMLRLLRFVGQLSRQLSICPLLDDSPFFFPSLQFCNCSIGPCKSLAVPERCMQRRRERASGREAEAVKKERKKG